MTQIFSFVEAEQYTVGWLRDPVAYEVKFEISGNSSE